MTIRLKHFDNMWRDYTFTDDGKVEVISTQDVESNLLDCNDIRNNEDVSKRQKSEFYRYASIPCIIWEKFEKMGITKDSKRLLKEIETNYPYFKTTNLREA